MSLVGAALARCGKLDAAGLAAVVAADGLDEAEVVAHPLVVRPTHRVPALLSAAERAVEQAGDPRVLDEVLAMMSPRTLLEVADRVPTPRVVRELAVVAAEGSTTDADRADVQWMLLRVGGAGVREDLVRALAGAVGTAVAPWKVLAWLAAATSCPHLLPDLVDRVPEEMRATVARFAGVAVAGRSPVDVFAREVARWVHTVGEWATDWTALTGGDVGAAWAGVVWSTGLEQVAAASLAAGRGGDPEAWAQVVAHPYLAGGRSYRRACRRLARALGARRLPVVVVVDGARLVGATSAYTVISWVAAGHDSAQDVAFAWVTLEQVVARYTELRLDELTFTGALLAAAELVCVTGGAGKVGAQAVACVRQLTSRARPHSRQQATLRVLDQLADVARAGAGVGGVRVDALAAAWLGLGRPSWMTRLVGEVFAAVPGVGEPVVLEALLSVADGFTGTLDDLTAVAVAVAA